MQIEFFLAPLILIGHIGLMGYLVAKTWQADAQL